MRIFRKYLGTFVFETISSKRSMYLKEVFNEFLRNFWKFSGRISKKKNLMETLKKFLNKHIEDFCEFFGKKP